MPPVDCAFCCRWRTRPTPPEHAPFYPAADCSQEIIDAMGANSTIPYGHGRHDLLAATIALIAAKGMHGFAMREVATQAQMVVGNVTYHFRYRSALVTTALTEYTEQVETDTKAIVAAAAEASSPDDVSDLVATALASQFECQPVLVRAEVRLEAVRTPEIASLATRLVTSVARLLEIGGSCTGAGAYRAALELDARALDLIVSDQIADIPALLTPHQQRQG